MLGCEVGVYQFCYCGGISLVTAFVILDQTGDDVATLELMIGRKGEHRQRLVAKIIGCSHGSALLSLGNGIARESFLTTE